MKEDALAETLPEPGLAGGGAGPTTSAQKLLGKVLKDQYRIDKELGQGAMGIVFRGTQLQLGKPVAIKLLRPDGFHGQSALDRFQREATLVSKLNHPSIAQVLDFGVDDGTPFLVMEFVDGKELTEVLELEGPMPPSRAIAIMRQLASALEEAHKQGVVHRDIKPHNLRLMRYAPGGQLFLKVLDFGIAKQLGDSTDGEKLTATGAVMGTPAYMSPEQAGGHKLDARADQYAAGIVLYELLTGTVPFTGQTMTGVIVSHLTKPPPGLPPSIPEPLRRITMRLLAKDPKDRFPDAAALDRALAEAEESCRGAAPLSRGKVKPLEVGGVRGPRDELRRTLLLGGGTLALAGAALATVLIVGPRLRHPPPTTPVTPTVTQPPVSPPPPEVKKPETPTPPTPGEPTTATPTAKPETATKPATVTEVPKPTPPETKPTKPTVAVGKPAPSAPEPPEVKEKLDDAEGELKGGNFLRVVELARQTTFTQKTARAYRLLTAAYCEMGDLGNAKASFHQVGAADRKALIGRCKKHDIDLP